MKHSVLWQCWGTPSSVSLFSDLFCLEIYHRWGNEGIGTAACNVAIGCCLAPGDQPALFFLLKLNEWSAPLQASLRSLGKENGGCSMFQMQTRRSKSGNMKWSLGVTMRRRVHVPCEDWRQWPAPLLMLQGAYRNIHSCKACDRGEFNLIFLT